MRNNFAQAVLLPNGMIKRDDSFTLGTEVTERLLPSIRILIADDYADWRRQVRLLLRARPEWQVIAEASDGSEAVQKVEELKPDLILLDIGLPKLHGIEAARRIRQLSPSSKIVFLSQNDDRDVVQAALSTGALGYVYKPDAEGQLLAALDAVLRGKQFVSSSLKDCEFTDSSEKKGPHRHEVLFYSDDAILLDSLARFIAVALRSGNVAIVVISEQHRDDLVLRLKAHGLDIDAASQQGIYIQLDVAKTLSTFMVNDMPDSARFFEVANGLIHSAAKVARGEHSRVMVCGEAVGVLWAEGKADAAIRLEQLWDEIGTTFEVDILCGYALNSFHGEADQRVFRSVCAEHSIVYSH
ncbi:MAG TPA: response regulator [Candidatus Acidoferrum sp.]|nr:response regulator [Candidatus Acidoferrum sp.]